MFLRESLLGVLVMVGFALFAVADAEAAKVKLGVEVFCEQGPPKDLVGAKFALMTNPTGADSQFRNTIDLLKERKDINLVCLFGPEHGIRGDRFDANHADEMIDDKTGLKVYSVFGGSQQKKLGERLAAEGVQCLVYDIQDVGSRGYTYIASMEHAMRVCAEKKIKFMVFDRPDPLGGNRIEGNILEAKFKSFVGVAQMPYVYGLTPGEFAQWINVEHKIGVDLSVSPLKGWRRDMTWEETGLPWVPTSPNVPDPDTSYFLVATGVLGELHIVNEGVGTTMPFEVIGAPWINRDKMAERLNKAGVAGIYFRPTTYMPRFNTYKDEGCHGVQLHITDVQKANLWQADLAILAALQADYPDKKPLEGGQEPSRLNMFDKVCGSETIRKDLLAGKSAAEIDAQFEKDRQEWIAKVSQYIIYKEGNQTFKAK